MHWVETWNGSSQLVDDDHCDICHKVGEGMLTVVWSHGIVYTCEECYGDD